jgi:hypothetical protein
MSYYRDDIDEKILDCLNQIFAIDLQQQPALTNDPLTLLTLKQAPLQDDPTLMAPYVVYNNNLDDQGQCIRLVKHGDEENIYGSAEIGGPIRYLYCYGCLFGTPEKQTRDQARADGAALMNRIIKTLIANANLSNILSPGLLTSDDQSKFIEGQNNRLVTGAGYSIFGGESTFYGRGKVYWQYPVSWDLIA